MSIHNARLRALTAAGLALTCLLAQASPARADDGPPTPGRAVPLARSIPRTFASYDALVAAATAVASDQAALSAELVVAHAEHDLAKTILAEVMDPRLRGGFIRQETNVSDEPSLAALRAEIAAATAAETRLLAGGAAATSPTPTWRRPLAGRTSQPFGPTYLSLEPARLYQGTYYWHFHEGLDIVAPAGTPIVAPAHGRVVFAGRMYDGAEVVVLAHDDGLVSLYAHLDAGPLAPTAKAGDIVDAGDRIGAVGLTGLTTGYHLHWAVYRNGEPLDPLSLLVR
jgi:murein DD-endopeptidase MepM/ murein hydrolase activator NlpD